MTSDWHCERDGVVYPYHVLPGVNTDAVEHVRRRAQVPLWVPWPLPVGWTVTGVGFAGDERTGARATALACAGPAPLGGVADLILVAEEPGVGLGARYAALSGPDPGPEFATVPHAKVTVGGHPTPLWSIPVEESRCAYIGEAAGCWLWAVLWPADAGYIFAEHVDLHDLRADPVPMLVFGAPSPYLGAGPR
jgi:hypothetical protein